MDERNRLRLAAGLATIITMAIIAAVILYRGTPT